MPPSRTGTGKLDVVALDIIRDRERGVPRFNEFRRQYGLKSLRGFDDFIDQRLPKGSAERDEQVRLVGLLREVYGQLPDFTVGEPEYMFSNFINGVRKLPATWTAK